MIGAGPVGTSPAPTEFAAPWGARGYVTQLDGPVHWIEFGQDGPGTPRQRPAEPKLQGPPIVFVHGLGGSHLNWCLIGPRLAAGRRAVALDLHGFGLTPVSIALASQRQALADREDSFLAASRSMLRVTGRRRRYWEMMAAVRIPVLLIGGDADRLVPVAAVRQVSARQPRWDTVVLAGVGHTAQLEVPDLVVGTVQDWLERHFSPPAG